MLGFKISKIIFLIKFIQISKLSWFKSLLSKIFKDITGVSPINYLIQIRLTKARQLLEKEEVLTVKEVAKAVGYEDAYHFSKSFKKHFGLSPSMVRTQEKKDAL